MPKTKDRKPFPFVIGLVAENPKQLYKQTLDRQMGGRGIFLIPAIAFSGLRI